MMPEISTMQLLHSFLKERVKENRLRLMIQFIMLQGETPEVLFCLKIPLDPLTLSCFIPYNSYIN